MALSTERLSTGILVHRKAFAHRSQVPGAEINGLAVQLMFYHLLTGRFAVRLTAGQGARNFANVYSTTRRRVCEFDCKKR